jgi:hypothetical protein
MTSFTKIGCTLLDTDDGNCLLAEASNTPGGLYVIPKAAHHARLSARALAANDSSSSSQCVLCAAKDETSVEFMGRMFCCNFLRKVDYDKSG